MIIRPPLEVVVVVGSEFRSFLSLFAPSEWWWSASDPPPKCRIRIRVKVVPPNGEFIGFHSKISEIL